MVEVIKKYTKNQFIKAVPVIILVSFLLLPAYAGFELLKSTDSAVRASEAARLGQLSDKTAVTELIKLLNDKSVSVRINTVVALGQIRDEKAVDPLIDTMSKDADPGLRIMAAQALGSFSNSKAKEALLKGSDAADGTVRAVALRALTRHGEDKEIEKIMDKAEKDNDWRVRKAAINSLAENVETRRSEKYRERIEKIIANAENDKDENVKRSAGEYRKRSKDKKRAQNKK